MIRFLPIIYTILDNHFPEEVHSIHMLKGLGSVNSIFDINGTFILRLNTDDPNKKLEYLKEYWCLEKVGQLGIPGPKVIKRGLEMDIPFMIQEKLPGINGKATSEKKTKRIWNRLGKYAALYHQIPKIEVAKVLEAEFHQNWKARLRYNIQQLNKKDTLLQHQIFTLDEQEQAKSILQSFLNKELKSGLIHGDLAPRNALIDDNTVYLLDWGTAEINVVPHIEIGILQMSEECSKSDLNNFLEGYGISKLEYQRIAEEIKVLSFLHRLDKYRWADGRQDIDDIEDYMKRVRLCFEQCVA